MVTMKVPMFLIELLSTSNLISKISRRNRQSVYRIKYYHVWWHYWNSSYMKCTHIILPWLHMSRRSLNMWLSSMWARKRNWDLISFSEGAVIARILLTIMILDLTTHWLALWRTIWEEDPSLEEMENSTKTSSLMQLIKPGILNKRTRLSLINLITGMWTSM